MSHELEVQAYVAVGRLKDQERIDLIRLCLESIIAEGTIYEIRQLVNDERWNDQPPRRPDPNCCAVCGWSLAAHPSKGCVRGNCSLRPRPSRLYDPERAAAESKP